MEETRPQALFPGEQQAQQSVIPMADIPFQASNAESFKAAWELGAMGRTTNSIAKLFALHEANGTGAKKFTPEQLNDKFKAENLNFDEPMTERAAQLVVDQNRQQRALQEIQDAGPSSAASTVGKFGAQLVSASLDPIDLLAGEGVGALFKLGVKGVQIARGIEGVVKTSRAAELGMHITEQTVGNLASSPITQAATEAYGQEYSFKDDFVNALGGAIGFSGIKYLGGKIVDHVRNRKGDLDVAIAKTAISQLSQDKKLNLEPHYRDVAKEINTDPIASNYIHKELTDANIKDTKFYAASDRVTSDFEKSGTQAFTDHYGEGVYLTDAEHVANGVAASKYSDINASVFETKLNDAKLLNMDERIPPELSKIVSDAAGVPVKENMNLKDVMDAAREASDGTDPTPKINEALKAAGYDGYRWKADNFGGTPVAEHNQAMLFDKSKVEATDVRPSNPKVIPQISEAERQQNFERSQDLKQHVDYSEEAHQRLEKAKQEALPEINKSEVDKQIQGVVEDIKAAEKQGLVTPEERALLKQIEEGEAHEKIEDEIVKAGTLCMER